MPFGSATGESTTLRLRHGLRADGSTHREAVVRPLCGSDELLLEEAGYLPAGQISLLLSLTVRSIGSAASVGLDQIRCLTVGDRERLLLALYATTFGRQVETVIACPTCATATELPLDLGDALAMGREEESEIEGTLVLGDLTVRFRLPNGGDQEQAAILARDDPDAASAMLAQTCLLSVAGPDGAPCQIDPERLQTPLETAFRTADPDAESVISIPCAECGATLNGVVDGYALLQGMMRSGRSILEDVDRLAAAYHWTEEAILALPTQRRRRYLALLDRRAAA